MKKHLDEETDQGRRDTLKILAMGVGVSGLSTFPILGQTESGAAAAHHMDMEEPAAQPTANWTPQFFDAHQNEMLIALTELIIPATDTPGAKGALVNRYLDLRFNEETPENQTSILQALAWFDGRSLALHNKPFLKLTDAQQKSLLESVSDPKHIAAGDEAGATAFGLMKDLTLFGYYTSQIGLDKELRYEGDRYNLKFPGACTHPEHLA